MRLKLFNEDCLETMKRIPDGYFDMILCDLPYGTTACKWDTIIPFDSLWEQYRRISKPTAAIVLFGAEPFSSLLRMSNLTQYRYDWVWDKVNAIRNHLNAKHQPLRIKELISVFYAKNCTYNPQMREGGYISRKTKVGQSEGFGKVTRIDSGRVVKSLYPIDILSIPAHFPNTSVHPTQKPVALLECLIKTYTNPGMIVLDNCMGSGSTGVACINTGRDFVGIEKEQKYFDIAKRRIDEALAKKKTEASTDVVVPAEVSK